MSAKAGSLLCGFRGGQFSRGEIDSYTEFVKIYGAKGLASIKVNEVTRREPACSRPS